MYCDVGMYNNMQLARGRIYNIILILGGNVWRYVLIMYTACMLAVELLPPFAYTVTVIH